MKPWEWEQSPEIGRRRGILGGAMGKKLKAPFPYFGGKSSVSSLVWDRLGDVDNYVEPFCGSAAMLLRRPHPPRIETLNDMDCYVSNFWRATAMQEQLDYLADHMVAEYADWPVNEADLHARHRWLVGVPSSPWTDTPYLHAMAGPDRLETDRREFRRRMRTDPDYYCTRTAGWWCWGLCCWIGSGWCQSPESAVWEQRPQIAVDGGTQGRGVHANGPAGGSGELWQQCPAGQRPLTGVHAKGEALAKKVPRLTNDVVLLAGPCGPDTYRPQLADAYSLGRGVHAGPLSEKRPRIDGKGHKGKNDGGEFAPGVLGGPRGPDDTNSLGRGVHAGPTFSNQRPMINEGQNLNMPSAPSTCAQRRAWLLDWFNRLRDRLRCVRVCCGDWSRVCSSESVTTRLGVTGVFLDPPYGEKAGRESKIYSVDSLTVADDVREWCLANGENKQMRIALCGYAGEGHEVLEERGWQIVEWKASGGYGNRSARGKANAKKERIWFSPHCKNERTLFDGLEK